MSILYISHYCVWVFFFLQLILILKCNLKIKKNFFVVALDSIWDLSSLTRGQTPSPCIGSSES